MQKLIDEINKNYWNMRKDTSRITAVINERGVCYITHGKEVWGANICHMADILCVARSVFDDIVTMEWNTGYITLRTREGATSFPYDPFIERVVPMDDQDIPVAQKSMDYWVTQMGNIDKNPVDLLWLFEHIQNAELPMKATPLTNAAAEEVLRVMVEKGSTSFLVMTQISESGIIHTLPINAPSNADLIAALDDIMKEYQRQLPSGLTYQVQTTVSIAVPLGVVHAIPIIKLR